MTQNNMGLTGVQNGTKCYHSWKSGQWKKDCYKPKAEEVQEVEQLVQGRLPFWPKISNISLGIIG